MKNRFLIVSGLLLGTSVFSIAQEPQLKVATQDEIKAQIVSAPCKMSQRLEAVKALFKQMGASDDEIKIDKYKTIQNVTVLKKGKTDDIIIVGAHYDKVDDGCGVIDNWSGVTIIANIYRTIRDMETDKSYLFVAFDQEEKGLYGSAAMAKAIPKEKLDTYCSMINFDTFGFNHTPVAIKEPSTPKVLDYAVKYAGELKMPFQIYSLGAAGDADSHSFKNREIPAITLSAIENGWQDYLHTSKDKIENMNFGAVLLAYKFGFRFVSKLDEEKCGVFRKEKAG